MSWLHATSSGMPSKVVPALAFSAWSVIVAATRNSPKMRRWLACDDREDAPSPCGVIASIALPLPPLGEAPLPPLPLPLGGIGSSTVGSLAREKDLKKDLRRSLRALGKPRNTIKKSTTSRNCADPELAATSRSHPGICKVIG